MKRFLPLTFLLPLMLHAQSDSIGRWQNTHYTLTGESLSSNGRHAPFWFSSNRYGLNSIAPQQQFLRLALQRDEQSDSARIWKLGYGIDLLAGTHQQSPLHLQQLYASLRYGRSRFTLGMKEEAAYWVNPELSTGSQTLGINARPLPGLRWDLDWTSISGKGQWAAISGHAYYGWVTDGKWQKEYAAEWQTYIQGTVLHHKAGYLRLGNPQKHWLHFTAGLEMAREFAGTVYYGKHLGSKEERKSRKMEGDALQYLFALVGTGGDDGLAGDIYKNNGGNTVGSWRFKLEHRTPHHGFGLKLYYDHFFEDHSALFEEYGWFDGLLGLELQFPQNPFFSSLVVEHLRTDYQSGPIYHDHTPVIPDQISAVDNYYNHGIFQGWQHYGMGRGNPLFVSPLYQDRGSLVFSGNRFRATHFGLSGHPTSQLSYRLLHTHLWSWGTYTHPYPEVKHQHSSLIELSYRWKNWLAKAALGIDRGDHIGSQVGWQISLCKRGILF